MEKKNKYLQIYLSIMENEKKMIFRDFSDFSIAGNNWKKKILIIMKKKLLQEFGNLLLHDLYCETVLWGTVAKTRRWARHQARTGALG